MIKYSLICHEDHEFEAWFSSGDDFDAQKKRGLLECPVCGSHKISKALMAPRVSGAKKPDDQPLSMATTKNTIPAEMVEKFRELKKHIETNSENVGDKFPDEARKIHYGEAETRSIYGKASVKEAIDLAEEGVGVVPLPELPEEKN